MPTIRSLLDFGGDSLRLLVPADPADARLDAEIAWVHNSELMDPTPFLEPGQLILTDGAQFSADEDPTEYEDYARRLTGRGIVGLGFGSRIVHGRVPVSLVEACRRHSLPLFEIADLTPFLALIRFVADEIASAQVRRSRWSAKAQRALSRAALRPDGLSSILIELENQLDCRAILFDAAGARISSGIGRSAPLEHEEWMLEAVATALERGVRSSSHLEIDGQGFTVQTVGQGAHLYGVLVISELESRDRVVSDVVNSVIAFATLALAQNRAQAVAHRHLRAGVLEQLLAEQSGLATRTAEMVWGRLPGAPATVLVTPLPERSDFLFDALEREAAEAGGRVFFAVRDRQIAVIAERGRETTVTSLLDHHGLPVGSSQLASLASLGRSVAEAARALRHAQSTGGAHVPFDELRGRGLVGLLDAADGGSVASRLIRPLEEADARRGADFLRTAEVWLDHDCAWEPTARVLGIHRHTLRHRIGTIERLTGLDLSSLPGRFELWAAFRLTNGGI